MVTREVRHFPYRTSKIWMKRFGSEFEIYNKSVYDFNFETTIKCAHTKLLNTSNKHHRVFMQQIFSVEYSKKWMQNLAYL